MTWGKTLDILKTDSLKNKADTQLSNLEISSPLYIGVGCLKKAMFLFCLHHKSK